MGECVWDVCVCVRVCVGCPKVCNEQRGECDLTSLIETSRATVKYRLTEEARERGREGERERERGEDSGKWGHGLAG